MCVNIYISFSGSSTGKESTCNAGDPSSIPGSGSSAGDGIDYPLQYSWTSLVARMVKNLPTMQETWFDPWVGKIPWRREWLATPAFWPGERSPWTEELGELLSVGLQRVGCNWEAFTCVESCSVATIHTHTSPHPHITITLLYAWN